MKIKKEIEELCLKQNFAFIEDMDRFEREEMKKTRPIKNIWYDWLINYTLNPIRKKM